MDIGEAMGRAMAGLLGTESVSFKKLSPYVDALTKPAYRALKKRDHVEAYRCLKELEKQLKEQGGGQDKRHRDSSCAVEAQLDTLLLSSNTVSPPSSNPALPASLEADNRVLCAHPRVRLRHRP